MAFEGFPEAGLHFLHSDANLDWTASILGDLESFHGWVVDLVESVK